MRWMSLDDAISVFADNMYAQADLLKEAKNLAHFRRNFATNESVIFPKPLDHLCTRKILVETWEDGTPISQYIATKNKHNSRLAYIGLDAYMQMMLQHNFIHADLHPGNIFVREEGGKPQLILIDVGLVSVLSNPVWKNFKDLFWCIVMGEGEKGAQLMLERAPNAAESKENREGYIKEVGAIFNQVRATSLADVKVGQLLSDVMSLGRKYQVKIEAGISTLAIGTVILEGIGKQLDPSMNLLTRSLPYLKDVVIQKDK